MRKLNLALAVLLLLSLGASAQERIPITDWLVYGPRPVPLPAFSDQKDRENRPFDKTSLLGSSELNSEALAPASWRVVKAPAGELAEEIVRGYQLYLLKTHVSVNRWTKGTLHLTLSGLAEVSLDDQVVHTRGAIGDQEDSVSLTLGRGKHRLQIKVLAPDRSLKMKAAFTPAKDFADCGAVFTTDPARSLTVNDVLEGEQVPSAQISPSGRYLLLSYRDLAPGVGKARSHQVIYDVSKRKNISLLRGTERSRIQWLPRSDRLSYTVSFEGAEDLYLYDFLRGEEKKLAGGLKALSFFIWSPTEDRIVFSRYNEADKPGDLKRIYGVEDRLPYFRNRSSLHLLDLSDGRATALTAGSLSADFHDFSPDGRHLLFATSRMDYSEVPFRKQTLHEMDLGTHMVRTVWTDKPYDGQARYSPDGKQLLVSGGPETFGDMGVKVSQGRIPNSYDGQIYLYNLADGRVEALSRDFDPAIEGAHWGPDGFIYVQVTEQDYGKLYRYDVRKKSYQNIKLPVEVLDKIDYDHLGTMAVLSGSGASMPGKVYLLDLRTNRTELVVFPEAERYAKIRFGACKPWNFVNKKGDTISGRVYFPPDFQEGKTYPLIVNYYGGTSPVERSFGGRYPLETWAAAGYMVYVLQPSGAIGFGQDFSALHVNGWGFDAIDDIIEGTKAFLSAHPMADARNVGCIGASYGGYTTMLLQTRTDLFKTAVSHAGISALTSYWGEGYWGYSYNTGAARGSYPWNRRDIYVENSPVYRADKFQNSILLIHGTDDTNVPVGESLQYYAALKLLGKDVEMVLVDGQNHHILDYKKRIKWHHTIVSWFDKKLKDQPQQWDSLYPEKNY
jgi:dipeptidyl aminopeptidase/acylaminoacyl peptidase